MRMKKMNKKQIHEKMSYEIQNFLHKNLNMGWQKNSDIYFGVQSIINKYLDDVEIESRVKPDPRLTDYEV